MDGTSARNPLSPSARLRAFLLRHRLDERLAAGEDPASDAELWARARGMTSARTRESLADTFEGIGRGTDRRERPGLGATAPINGRAVVEASGAFARAVDALRDGVVTPRGTAQLFELLRDSDGPLYVDRGEGALARAIDRALER